MENRIKINGVWYVREDTMPPRGIILDESDLTHFLGVVYEDDNYSFEATKSFRDFNLMTMYDSLYIEITFKKPSIPMKDWEKECWDSTVFFKGILEGNEESLRTLENTLNDNGVRTFKSFLVYLEGINWL